MNLSNRIYSRKVFFRMLYTYNFSKSILWNEIYSNTAKKIDNIVKLWLDKINESEFQNFDFSLLLDFENKKNTESFSMDEYITYFNPENAVNFEKVVNYTTNFFVKKKEWVNVEYDYLIKNAKYLIENYKDIVNLINENLPTFKFDELNSIDQAILLLWVVESEVYKTPKAVIIKECMFLASTFGTDNSVNLINAVLDKSLWKK